jgi:probable F420-dependent oxidoreductase
MKVGLFAPLANPIATPEHLETLAKGAEERGFHSIWVAEHVVLFDQYESRYPYAADGKIPAGGESGILDPFPTLAYLAAHSKTIRLGTGICLVPQRNPVYTAKEVATVDYVSNGRVDFGVGIGWLEEEFQALGMRFDRRGDICREYLEVMKRLWCDPISEHHGEFYDLPACRHYPKPVQEPHPPIHFGGETNAALRRVADLGQGWYGFGRGPDEVPERIATLTRLLEERGRKRGLQDGDIEGYEEAGVDQVIVMAFAMSPDALEESLDGLAGAVGLDS